jgi:ABC-type transport system substrate-binding protein
MELAFAFNAGDGAAARRAVIVQRNLADLGIAVDLRPYPYAEMVAADGPERNGRFSFALTGLIGGSDAEASANALSCADAKPGGSNFGRYCSPLYDARLADQVTTPNAAQRSADFAELERRLREDLPLIPLHQYAAFWGVSARVAPTYQRDPLDFPLHAETWDAL